MKRRSHAKRRDLNEPGVVSALVNAGAWVKRTDDPGDLLVYYRDRWFVLEVKSEKGRLTPAQEEVHAILGPGAIPIVRDAVEAVEYLMFATDGGVG